MRKAWSIVRTVALLAIALGAISFALALVMDAVSLTLLYTGPGVMPAGVGVGVGVGVGGGVGRHK